MLIQEILKLTEEKSEKEIKNLLMKLGEEIIQILIDKMIKDFPNIDLLKELKYSKLKKSFHKHFIYKRDDETGGRIYHSSPNKIKSLGPEFESGFAYINFWYFQYSKSKSLKIFIHQEKFPKSKFSNNEKFSIGINFDDSEHDISDLEFLEKFEYNIFNKLNYKEIILSKLYPKLFRKIKRNYSVLF